jgi:hypothetical protein
MSFNFIFNNNIDLYVSYLKLSLLLISFFYVGYFITKMFDLKPIFQLKYIFLSYIFIGNIILSFLIYYFVFLFDINVVKIKYISLFLYLFSFTSLAITYKRIQINFKYIFNKLKFRKDLKVLFIFLVGYFLVSFSPVTAADALDYHLGFAKELLKYHSLNFRPDWFHINLAGINEYILLLSVGLNVEQLGSVLEFFSLLSILSVFFKTGIFNKKNRDISIWIILTLPVLLFLISSPKPQLTSIALSLNIFSIILKNKGQYSNKIISLLSFCLFYLSITKINFLLSLFFLTLLILVYQKYDKLNFKKCLFIIILFLIVGFIVIFPYLKYKFSIAECFKDYIYPIPLSVIGSEEFVLFLQNYRESVYIFPISLILPSNLSSYTTIFGMNFIILIVLIFNSKINYKNLFFFLSFLIIAFLLGQNTTRFYLEPFLWALLLIYLYNKEDFLYFKYFKFFLQFQAIVLSVILIYSICSLSVGVLSVNLRKKVLYNKADGYDLAMWVNNKLPANSNVIIQHRSLFLFDQNTFFTNSLNDSLNSILFIKRLNISYLVTTSINPNADNYNYISKKLLFGPFKFKVSKRNPFSPITFLYANIYRIEF